LLLPQYISFLAVINIFTLPYTLWSVWYQKVKAKQWCPLCLIVQALLWGIFTVNLFLGFIQMPVLDIISLTVFSSVAGLYGIFMLIFNLLIPKLGESSKIERLNQEINSIKANEYVFINLLKQQPCHKVSESDSQILFGNPSASLRISIFSNPYCNPCASLHRRIEKFLQTTDSVCIQYLFSSFEPNLDFANKSLIATYLKNDKNKAMQIFSEWFENGKTQKEAFFKDFQLDMNNPAIEAEFQRHEEWKAKTQLRATQTILVNGYQLPENYKIEDLRYFTEFNIDVK
jgi:hypothetical protein